MKKIMIAILMIFGFNSIASADLGINVGISGSMAAIQATGTDEVTQNSGLVTTSKEDATAVAGWGSVFIEKTLPGPLSRLAIGIDWVGDTLSTETAENDQLDLEAQTADEFPDLVNKVNTVQIDFKDLTTLYLTASITENLYIKGGVSEVDVITNESLATGSSYGNTSLEGTVIGIGFNKTMDNGFFVRAESTYMTWDTARLTSGHNTVSLGDLAGVKGAISIGKSF